MHDFKNIFIAAISSVSSVCTAIEAKTVITIISAIVLPIVLFTLGKTVDVCLQVYFRRLERKPPACPEPNHGGRSEIEELRNTDTGMP